MVQSDIDVDNVAILQRTLIGNTVTNGLVDGSADRLGEVHIVQRRGIRLKDMVSMHIGSRARAFSYITLYASLVDNLIDIVGCDARFQFTSSSIQNLTSQAAHFAHALLLFLVENGDVVAANNLLLGARNAIAGVVWVGDRLGDRSLGRQRIDGPQRTSVGEGGVRIECTGVWIWFRNHFRWKDIGEEITLFVNGLVLVLERRVSLRLFYIPEHSTNAPSALSRENLPSCA